MHAREAKYLQWECDVTRGIKVYCQSKWHLVSLSPIMDQCLFCLFKDCLNGCLYNLIGDGVCNKTKKLFFLDIRKLSKSSFLRKKASGSPINLNSVTQFGEMHRNRFRQTTGVYVPVIWNCATLLELMNL